MKRHNEAMTIMQLLDQSRIVVIICTLSMISSCVVQRPDYPAHWSKINRDSSTKALSGTYHDSLVSVLGYGNLSEDTRSCKALLQIDDGLGFLLRKRCISGTDTLYLPVRQSAAVKLKIKKRKGAIRVSYLPVSSAGNPIVGVNKSYVWLYTADDGSLIVRKGAYSYGLVFFLIPMVYNTYQWYQFDANAFKKVTWERSSEK